MFGDFGTQGTITAWVYVKSSMLPYKKSIFAVSSEPGDVTVLGDMKRHVSLMFRHSAYTRRSFGAEGWCQ